MLDPLLVAGLSADVVAGAPGLILAGRPSLADRDEFGPIDGAPGLFRASGVPTALAEADLGRVLVAVPREDLL